MKKILLTGFDVWGQETYNSSWEMLCDISPTLPPDWYYETLQLPVSWERAPLALSSGLTPDTKAVVAFGMSKRDRIDVERIAVNLTATRSEDVDNLIPAQGLVCDEGPPAYWTGLPYREIIATLRSHDIPCDENHYAGDYLCNYIFYWLMHYVTTCVPDIIAGFIHVPHFDMHGGLSREMLSRAADSIAAVVVDYADRNQLD